MLKFTLAYVYCELNWSSCQIYVSEKESKDSGAHQRNPTEIKYNFYSIKNSRRESTGEINMQTRIFWYIALEDDVTTILRNVDSCLSSYTV